MKRLNLSGLDVTRWFMVCGVLLGMLGCAVAAPPCVDGNLKQCGANAINQGDFDGAYELLLSVGNSGDAESQITIALLISNGYGLQEAKLASRERRQLLALPWIERAADGGNLQAINWLADGYRFGWFGFKVDSEREKCLRSAAKNKIAVAYCRK